MSDVITVPSHTKKDNPKAALKPRPHRQRRNQVPTSSFQMTGDTRDERLKRTPNPMPNVLFQRTFLLAN